MGGGVSGASTMLSPPQVSQMSGRPQMGVGGAPPQMQQRPPGMAGYPSDANMAHFQLVFFKNISSQ